MPNATRDEQIERRNAESAELTVGVERLAIQDLATALPIRFTGTI